MINHDNQSYKIETTEEIRVWGVSLSRKNIVPDELADTLYTNEERALLGEWVSPHELHTLRALFGKTYISTEYKHILHRLERCNTLLKHIASSDKTVLFVCKTSYNQQRKQKGELVYPYNKKIDNKILIDLFSRGDADLLSFKIDPHQVHGLWDSYIFTPQKVVYVDVMNKDWDTLHQRGIKGIRIKDDGLRFISLLPDNAVNYVVSWYDHAILRSDYPLGKEYIDYLIDEIARTTQKGGLVTWIDFHRNDLLKKKWMIELTPKEYLETLKTNRGKNTSGFYCYEKK